MSREGKIDKQNNYVHDALVQGGKNKYHLLHIITLLCVLISNLVVNLTENRRTALCSKLQVNSHFEIQMKINRIWCVYLCFETLIM